MIAAICEERQREYSCRDSIVAAKVTGCEHQNRERVCNPPVRKSSTASWRVIVGLDRERHRLAEAPQAPGPQPIRTSVGRAEDATTAELPETCGKRPKPSRNGRQYRRGCSRDRQQRMGSKVRRLIVAQNGSYGALNRCIAVTESTRAIEVPLIWCRSAQVRDRDRPRRPHVMRKCVYSSTPT